ETESARAHDREAVQRTVFRASLIHPTIKGSGIPCDAYLVHGLSSNGRASADRPSRARLTPSKHELMSGTDSGLSAGSTSATAARTRSAATRASPDARATIPAYRWTSARCDVDTAADAPSIRSDVATACDASLVRPKRRRNGTRCAVR